jgi:hypothetical protein
MLSNALPDTGEISPRIEAVKFRGHDPSPLTGYAMFTPSSVRVY